MMGKLVTYHPPYAHRLLYMAITTESYSVVVCSNPCWRIVVPPGKDLKVSIIFLSYRNTKMVHISTLEC